MTFIKQLKLFSTDQVYDKICRRLLADAAIEIQHRDNIIKEMREDLNKLRSKKK